MCKSRTTTATYSWWDVHISAAGLGTSLENSSLALNPGQDVSIGPIKPAALVQPSFPASPVLLLNSFQQLAQLWSSFEHHQDLPGSRRYETGKHSY